MGVTLTIKKQKMKNFFKSMGILTLCMLGSLALTFLFLGGADLFDKHVLGNKLQQETFSSGEKLYLIKTLGDEFHIGICNDPGTGLRCVGKTGYGKYSPIDNTLIISAAPIYTRSKRKKGEKTR